MKNDTRKTLLKQFSEYVYYSSSEYKYNKSYLEDKISQFTNYIEKYNEKKKIVKEYQRSLASYSIKNFDLNIRIEFDESFKLSFDKKKWNFEEVKLVNIILIENEKIYIKIYFLNEDKDIFFSNYYIFTKGQDIKEFIKEQIELFRKEQKYVNS